MAANNVQYESLDRLIRAQKTYGSFTCQRKKSKSHVTVESMLTMVGGFGCFQWILDVIFCLMMFPASYQVLIMYFAAMTPSWKCVGNSSICTSNVTLLNTDMSRCHMPKTEWTFTETKSFSIVTSFNLDCGRQWLASLTTSIFFIGWGLGSIILGYLADAYGRKAVIFPSFALLMIVGLISPFFNHMWLFICTRFVAGFMSPVGIQMFILISEYVDSEHRGFAGNIIYISGSSALCLLGLMSYLVHDWKVLFVICTAPYLVLLLFIKFVPESVRWLNVKGKTDEINVIFSRISKWNNVRLPAGVSLGPSVNPLLYKSNPLDLFRTGNRARKTGILAYNWFTLCMVYYGLSLSAEDLGGNVYRNFVLIAGVEIPATILAICLMEKFGRKRTSMATMLIGGAACVSVTMVPGRNNLKILRLAIGMLGKLCLTASVRIVFTWSVEIFPTIIRAEGLGFLQIVSRIGAASSPWIVDSFKHSNKNAPFFIMGCAAMVGSLLVLLLPETKGKQLLEVTNSYKEISETKTCESNVG